MTQTSAQWNGAAGGADITSYPSPYCATAVARYQRGLSCLARQASQGPIYTDESAYIGQLAVTNPGGDTIRFATGRAIVNGWIYENDATVDVTASSGNGYYTSVLQLSTTSQTIRAALIYNAAVPPTLTQNATTWEIPLASFQRVAGVIGTLTDERDFLNAQTYNVFVPTTDGYNDTDVTDLSNNVDLIDNKVAWSRGFFILPTEFISDLNVRASVLPVNSGNVASLLEVTYGACGQNPAAHTDQDGSSITAISNAVHNCIHSLDITTPAQGDIFRLRYKRFGNDVNDTIGGSVLCYGFIVQYFGYTR